MAEYSLETPLSEENVRKLRAGDKVSLTGVVYTARDAAHKRLVDLLEAGKELPMPLEGHIIYYVGPAPTPPGKAIGSAGPTTSYRMDVYTPKLIESGLKGMIGKGTRSREVKESMMVHKAVYFAAIGGVGALLAKTVKEAEVIAYPDLGPEAIRRLVVEDFPAIVAIDVRGEDIYSR